MDAVKRRKPGAYLRPEVGCSVRRSDGQLSEVRAVVDYDRIVIRYWVQWAHHTEARWLYEVVSMAAFKNGSYVVLAKHLSLKKLKSQPWQH